MPYLKKTKRQPITAAISSIPFLDEGDLNFAIAQLFMKFCDSQAGPLDYRTLNSGLGAINEAQAEIRRRILVPYENQKKLENSDVFLDFIRKHNLKEIMG